jgi:hypothetical protein
VSHQSFDTKVRVAFHLICERRDLIITDANPAHTGVDLDVNICDGSASFRSAVEKIGSVELVDDGRQVVVEDQSFLSGPKTSQTQDELSNAGVTKLNPLFRKSDAEPIDPLFLKAPRAGNRTVSVGVGLYHGHVPHVCADELFHRFKIERKVVEVDLGPCRPLRREVKH